MGKNSNEPFPLDVQKLKGFQLQGGSPTDPLTRGSAPGPPLGATPPDPSYMLALPRLPCRPPPKETLWTPLGSAPDPAGGAYCAPKLLAGFKGPTSKGMEGRVGREGRGKRQGKEKGREGYRKGREGRDG